MTSLLQTTRQTDLEPLTASGLPVFQTFSQVRAQLRSRLGAEHANLFAEPNLDPVSGVIQWYAPMDGRARRLVDMPADEAAEARKYLAQLTHGIEQQVAALGAGTSEERQLGKVLGDMLEIPGEDAIFVVGKQPVLAAWGHVQRGPQAPRQVLRTMARQVLAAAAVPAGATAAAAGAGATTQPPPAVERIVYVERRRSWVGNLLWLLFAALMLTSGYQLLKHCALGPPGSTAAAWLSFCPLAAAPLPPAPVARERDQLADKLAYLRRELDERRRSCRRAEAPPAAPDTPTRTVQERGGRIGKVNVILSWQSRDDLDIHVACPGDTGTIYYSKRRQCGGELDVDANNGSIVPDPVENVYLKEDSPPGRYVVRVNRYKDRPTRSEPTPFTVTVLVDGQEVERRTGMAGRNVEVLTFDLPYRVPARPGSAIPGTPGAGTPGVATPGAPTPAAVPGPGSATGVPNPGAGKP